MQELILKDGKEFPKRCVICPINQRQYGKKLMKRQVVVTDPEGGSKKYWCDVCTYKKSTLKNPWGLIMRDLNCSDIDCNNNHAKSKGKQAFRATLV